ncbi:Probable calcium-binding protein CML10 [Linum grandiflorum]
MSFRALFRRNKSKKSTASENSPPISSSFNGSQSPPRCPADELELVFKKFDVNGDGKISASELGSIMSSLGQKASEEELQKKMISGVDNDGDGTIDFEEFKMMMLRL